MAYSKGNKAFIRIVRDDGYLYEQDLGKYFSNYPDWPEYERQALEHVQNPVLDIGCGAGRHSLWLQDNGFEVTAIDTSHFAVEVAKQRGVKDCRVIDVRNIDFSRGAFGSILLIGTQFGVAGSLEDTKRIMEKFREILQDDGSIIATSNDISKTDNVMHVEYLNSNRRYGRITGEVTLRMEYETEVGDWFRVLLVTPNELKKICMMFGWTVNQIYLSKKTAYASVLKKNRS
jgi:SAM-dependent methyltransferase